MHINRDTCAQVYTRKNLLSKVTNVVWSTGTYQGNRKRSLMGHELFAQVQTVLLIHRVICVSKGSIGSCVNSPWEGRRVNKTVDERRI